MTPIRKILFAFFFLSPFFLHAQDANSIEYGKISVNDFAQLDTISDAGTGAVIIAHIGKVHYEKNEVGNYDAIEKVFLRVKIVSKIGYKAGNITIPLNLLIPYYNILVKLPRPGLIEIKGTTYNLVNGKIEMSFLSTKDIFLTKELRNFVTEKFAMPDLREGSIFDLEYTIRQAESVSEPRWVFQHDYPCLWSEFDLNLPDAHLYTIKFQGDSIFQVHQLDSVNLSYTRQPLYRLFNGSTIELRDKISHFHWVKTNVPAMIAEPFISTRKNFYSALEFYHAWYVYSSYPFRNYTSSNWNSFTRLYYLFNGMEDFEDRKYSFLNSTLKNILNGANTETEKARAIFAFVRDHYTVVGTNNYFASQSVKETFENKTGNNADINLLLTAMFHQSGIKADPAVLSTTDNGYGYLRQPIPTVYNYLICVASLNNRKVLFDASDPLNAYGSLPADCYNGGTQTLNTQKPEFIPLNKDSLSDFDRTTVIISGDEKGKLSGSLTMNCSPVASYSIRKKIKSSSKKEFFTEYVQNSPVLSISNDSLDDLENPDKPVVVHFDMDLTDSIKNNHIYFTPVLFPHFKKNPFINTTRLLPVELPNRIDNIYLITMDIPKDYQVDEMPKSELIVLNESEGSLEYNIEQNDGEIQLRVRCRLNKTYFKTDEYFGLRDFVAKILKKENEQIVFRKTGQ